ncbi:MAG: TraR/DksA C4-type zinc finger protein [Alphaproteobacteria bacterium]|nr:TraR/DksA C4-type zinc finger protein [Alphaproteobacteria bacterium]
MLATRREELARLIGQAHEAAHPVEVDQTSVGRLSRMDALQAQAMAQETERRRHAELSRLDSALERLASGEYGWCTACGDEIAAKRLELDPTTPLCIKCARAAH